jgi:Flp pilus assembly protein TadB
MGKALSCPFCLSCYQDAVVLPKCCHVYCRDCLATAFSTATTTTSRSSRMPHWQNQQQQQHPKCPTCQTPTQGRRSVQDAPHMNELVQLYKRALRDFGLAPLRYVHKCRISLCCFFVVVVVVVVVFSAPLVHFEFFAVAHTLALLTKYKIKATNLPCP